MTSGEQVTDLSPPWVSYSCGLLAGWLAFLCSGSLIMIGVALIGFEHGMTFQFRKPAFYGLLLVAGLPSLLIGGLSGRALFRWISTQRATVAYAWLAALVILTILTFPQTFTFTIAE